MRDRVYLVTGASSGIGRALALALARPGRVIGLLGRDAARLGDVTAVCAAKGAAPHVLVADVRRRDELRATILEFDAEHPVECIIASAGISVGTQPSGEIESEADTLDLLETNLLGTLATVLPLIPRMRARGKGRIALLSSVAALAPLPDAAAYSASKAALLTYGLAMRERLHDDGIAINVVCPGFVATPMAARYSGWKPLPMSPDEAARRILYGMEQNRAVIAFPWPLVLAARAQAMLPEPLRRLAYRAFRFSVIPEG